MFGHRPAMLDAKEFVCYGALARRYEATRAVSRHAANELGLYKLGEWSARQSPSAGLEVGMWDYQVF